MIRLRVTGMTCGHCEQAVEKALAAIPGVQQVQVSREEGTAVVEGSPDRQALVRAVEDEGYKAEVMA
ncbi:MAG TPA: heavy metal-associated domain-containing protein [Nitrococcus sp.]|nr:heavy metal-associated domain-containing protein [Nitrococcus sp.]